MYAVSDAYKNQITAADREFAVRMTFTGLSGGTATASGNPVVLTDSAALPLRELTIDIPPSLTPSIGVGVNVTNGKSEGTKKSRYIGSTYGGSYNVKTGELTRNWTRITLTGEENWGVIENNAAGPMFYCSGQAQASIDSYTGLCSHFPYLYAYYADAPGISVGGTDVLVTPATTSEYNADVDAWKTYLAEQNAAGTPVLISYPVEPTVSTTTVMVIPEAFWYNTTIEATVNRGGESVPTSATVEYEKAVGFTGSTIQNITLDEVINSTDAMTMGCACSNKVTVNLIEPPTDIAYMDSQFTVEAGLRLPDTEGAIAWVPLGVFYGADPETTNDFRTLKLTAYDGFCRMTGAYVASVGATTTLQALYDDLRVQLASNCNIVLKARTTPNYTISNFPMIEDITYAQAVAYVAGCLGGMARFDRNGELEIVWYEDSGIEIPRSLQYMNGFTRTTDKVLKITSISTGTKDNPLVYGEGENGTAITFENPYITDEMATAIFAERNGFSYTPCTVQWRGNPAIQAGDIVTVPDKNGVDHTVLVMRHSLRIGGGCLATIECKGTSATKTEFTKGFVSTGTKISRLENAMEAAIKHANELITGNQGGYVVLHDTNADGKPDEILIMDTENIETATAVWRWNKSGLAFGNSYDSIGDDFAITMDGKLNANFITTGELAADLITAGCSGDNISYFDLNENLIHIGGDEYYTEIKNGTLRQYAAAFGGEVGGIIPTFHGENGYMCLYYNASNSFLKSVSISYESGGVYTDIARFSEDGVKVFRDICVNGNITNYPGQSTNITSDTYICLGAANTGLSGYKVLISGNTYADGKVYSTGDVSGATITNRSDRKIKKNIRQTETTDALSAVNALSIYDYQLIDTGSSVRMGLMADEAPSEILSADGEGINLYSYCGLLAMAIKELSEKVDKKGGKNNGKQN